MASGKYGEIAADEYQAPERSVGKYGEYAADSDQPTNTPQDNSGLLSSLGSRAAQGLFPAGAGAFQLAKLEKENPEFSKHFAESLAGNIVNTPGNLINAVSHLFGHGNVAPIPFENLPQDMGGNAGNFASAFVGPGLYGKGIGLAANALKDAPIVGEGINALSQAAQQYPKTNALLKNAAVGLAYSPDNPLLGLALAGAPAAVASAGRALHLPTWLGGHLSPEELQKNLEASAGTDTHLGEVLQSPGLKKWYENFFARLPFSGGMDTFINTAKDIRDKGKDIIDSLRGETPYPDLVGKVNTALKGVFREQKDIKNALYNDLDTSAEKEGFSPDVSRFQQTVNRYKRSLSEQSLSNLSPELQDVVSHLSDTRKALGRRNAAGDISLSEANMHAGELGRLAKNFLDSPNPADRLTGGIYQDMHDAISRDIKKSLELNASPELIEKYKNAQSHYANNFAPFLDKDIYPYLRNGKIDPDTLLSHFVKGGPEDRATLLSKLMNLLPEDAQKAFGGAYLSRALDKDQNLNPLKFNELLRNLGPNQFEALFPNANLQNALKNQVKLTGLNPKALSIMQNPETGATLNPLATLGTLFGAGTAVGGPLAGMGAIGAGIGGSRIANKLLTSEAVRKGVVNALMRPKNQAPSALGNALARIPIATNSLFQNQ